MAGRFTIAALALLAGCIDAPEPRQVPQAATFEGTTWALRALDGRPVPSGRSPAATVTFGPEGTFAGTSACNGVGTSALRWRADRTGIAGKFAPNTDVAGPVTGLQTMIGCPDPRGVEEGGAFWRRMRTARSWRRDGSELTIAFADGGRATLALIPGAQANSAPTPAEAPAAYAFVGSDEPHASRWRGVIFGDRMMYAGPGGAGWFQTDVARERRGDEERITAGNVEVTIERGGCAGQGAYPDRVTFRQGGERYRGCGGPYVAPETIEGTTWTLRELNGQAAPDGPSPAATVTFVAGGAFIGTTACNDTSGGIRWRRDGRFEHARGAGPITTLAGCMGRDAMAFGGRFWGKIPEAVSWTRRGSTLTIRFADGTGAGLALIL